MVEYIGEVNQRQKRELLEHATALLFPIDWPEPFGLVMAEALACGTPVVARRRGSVPEVITHGLTGLIGETDEELAALCRSLHMIDRRDCRAEAVRRFSTAAMANGYEAIYQRVIQAPEAAWDTGQIVRGRQEAPLLLAQDVRHSDRARSVETAFDEFRLLLPEPDGEAPLTSS
jgi:hypothetical protein